MGDMFARILGAVSLCVDLTLVQQMMRLNPVTPVCVLIT